MPHLPHLLRRTTCHATLVGLLALGCSRGPKLEPLDLDNLVAASPGEENLPTLAEARQASKILVMPLADRAAPDLMGRMHNALDDLIRRDLMCLPQVSVFHNGAVPVSPETIYAPGYRQLQTALDAANTVGATHVIIGEVARHGDQIAVAVDIVDVGAKRIGATIRAQQIERKLLRALPAFRLSIVQYFDPTFTRATDRVPGMTPTLGQLQRAGHAQNQAAMGDYSQAIIDFYSAAKRENPYADAYLGIAETQLLLGAPEVARGAFRRALASDPAHAEVYWRYGLMQIREGGNERADALALVQETARQAPLFGPAHLTLGTLWFQEKRYDHADAHFLVAAELLPRSYWPHFNHAHVLQAKGDVDGAHAAFLRAAELGPHEPRIHNDLGLLLRDLGDGAGALRHFQTAANLDLKNPLYLYYVGEQYEQLGDGPQAVSAYRTAAAYTFNHPWLHRKLAEGFLRAKLATEAERTLAAGYSSGVREPAHVLLFARVLLSQASENRIRRRDYSSRAGGLLASLLRTSLSEENRSAAEALARRADAMQRR